MGLSVEEKERRKQERRRIKWENEHKVVNEIVYKYCVECKQFIIMDNEHFYVNDKNSIDGFSNRCKKCDKKRSVKNRHDNIERARKSSLEWNQRNSDRIKEVNLRYRRESLKHKQEYQAEWLKNHPDRVKYYSENKRKHDISTAEWNACLEIFDNSCAYCGIHKEKHYKNNKQSLHKEHVDDEGYNDLRNCVPACRSCNCKKWVFPIDLWYNQDNPNYTKERYDKIIWWITEGYKDYIEDKPPYKIIRKQNKSLKTYHYELWTIDEKRNPIECIAIKSKKKDLNLYINDTK